jgi:NAD(P)-dependent dehydrogenase (short-subunit alcohol dehydrogenase family)
MEQPNDTTIYADQLSLFAEAESRFSRVDIVVANAGITIAHDASAPGEDITVEPTTKELDVNLKGVLFTSRIGIAYLRKAGREDLVLVSSIAGFKESPRLTPYLASKHGVIGILRGLRISAIAEGIRVNVVCPWMTSKWWLLLKLEHCFDLKSRNSYCERYPEWMGGAKIA